MYYSLYIPILISQTPIFCIVPDSKLSSTERLVGSSTGMLAFYTFSHSMCWRL
jgi:hypothetical protein